MPPDPQPEAASRDELAAARFIEAAGVYPHVGVEVVSVDAHDHAVAIEVCLRFYAEHPVCCGEPACYVPFLRPLGLASLAEDFQDHRALLLPPLVTVVVTPVFESGFGYREERWRPDPSPMSFRSDA